MRDSIETLVARSAAVVQRHLKEVSADLVQVARGQSAAGVTRGYEAGSMGRRMARMNATGTDGTSEVLGDGSRTRYRSRAMERDSSYAQKALRSFAIEQVGEGIRPKFTAEKDAVERVLKRDWEDWSYQVDGATNGTVYGIQLAAVMALARDGGVLSRRRWRRVTDRDQFGRPLAVPLQIQLLEVDHLSQNMDGPTKSNGLIVNGIELDALGRRVAYHLFRNHPGAAWQFGAVQNALDTVAVPASELAHVYLYNFARPGQMVDVPWLHAVIARLWDLDGWQDSTMLARRMSASVAAFVEGGDPLAPPDTVDGINPRPGSWATSANVLDGRGFPIEQFEAGMVAYLPNGKTVKFPDQPQVPGHEETTRVTLREIAAGTGDSYESLSGDLTGSNFISLRHGTLPRQYLMRSIRKQVTIPLLVRPMGIWFLEAEALMRRYNPDRDVVSIDWIPPAREDVDEMLRQKIIEKRVRNNMEAWINAVTAEGKDPEELLAAIAKGNELRDRYNLVADLDPRQQTAAGQPVNSQKQNGTTPPKTPKQEGVTSTPEKKAP